MVQQRFNTIVYIYLYLTSNLVSNLFLSSIITIFKYN